MRGCAEGSVALLAYVVITQNVDDLHERAGLGVDGLGELLHVIEEWLSDRGIFLAKGTQGAVWPAAGFVREAKVRRDAETVEFNLARTEISHYFSRSVFGPAGTTLPDFERTLYGVTAP